MIDWDKRLNDLSSPDEEIRRQAVKALADSRDERALMPIIGAMGDASWRVRKEASEAVMAFAGPTAARLLLPGLRDGLNAGRRNTAVETLIRMGPVVIPVISPLLNDDDPDVRKFVVDILGGLEADEVVPLLMDVLADEDENVVATAVEYLGLKRDLRGIPALLRLLERKSFWLNFCALRAIGQLADEEQEEEILAFLDDQSLRMEAIDVLARIGGEKAFRRLTDWHDRGTLRERQKILGALIPILYRMAAADESRGRRLAATVTEGNLRTDFDAGLSQAIKEARGDEKTKVIRVGGLFPSPAVMEALIGILEESEEEEREDIVRTLASFPEEFFQALFPHLSSASTIIRRKVTGVFSRHPYPPSLTRLLPLLGDDDGHVRALAASALGHLGDKSALVPLCQLLRDAYPDVRQAAVDALTEMAVSSASARGIVVDIITSTIEAEKERIAEGSLQVLGNMADEKMIPVFTRFLKDARTNVRRAALNGLGRMRTPAAMEVVLTALTDEDPDVRMEAIRYLGLVKGLAYRQAVMALVEDEDNLVAAEALRSLGTMGGEESMDVLREYARRSSGLKQLAAIRGLCASGGEGDMDLLVGILPSVPTEGKKEIIGLLGRHPRPDRRKALEDCLADPDWSVRLAATEALGKAGDAQSLARLKAEYYPREKDPMVRRAMESLMRSRE